MPTSSLARASVNCPRWSQCLSEWDHVQDLTVFGGYLDTLSIQSRTGSELVGQHMSAG